MALHGRIVDSVALSAIPSRFPHGSLAVPSRFPHCFEATPRLEAAHARHRRHRKDPKSHKEASTRDAQAHKKWRKCASTVERSYKAAQLQCDGHIDTRVCGHTSGDCCAPERVCEARVRSQQDGPGLRIDGASLLALVRHIEGADVCSQLAVADKLICMHHWLR